MCKLASTWEARMSYRDSLSIITLLVALSTPLSNAQAHDESKYPDWKGQWGVIVAPGLEGQAVKFDPNKPSGRRQETPLTAEDPKVHQGNIGQQGQGRPCQ